MKDFQFKIFLHAGALAIGGVALSLFACRESEKDVVRAKSISEVVSSNPEFSILNAVIQHSGMSDSLSMGTFTMFAPNNDAFERINIRNSSVIFALPKDSVEKFLKYHLLAKRLSYSQFSVGDLKNINNSKLLVTKRSDKDSLLINLNRVLTPDVNASNGIIQVIDSVLLKIK
ncbi:fasciclin domain-containing protein [Dyadobacter sp. CY261]|uniref:fasciclin domain-containing protein n=1 Tax=Dyadobacter sp. CY261 TaxID=2907203 RepID=UPI001F18336F|nr:fasciclin domain-containing protein [Dyadobacter sp. CY261]MCF0075744.1 fasciclin domain-containing protein [Dyadobacter sp. CY261]